LNQRYFIKLSYKGTNYHGWQIQPNAATVQQFVNDALSKYLGHIVETIGCGRTDTGVHAQNFYAHFNTHNIEYIKASNCVYKLNCILPPDIVIHNIFEVNENNHARFDAITRTYKYYINKQKNPFVTETSWYCNKKLNINAMNEASSELLLHNQFTTFSKLHSNNSNDLCTIHEAYWEEKDDTIIFSITANRFLRNMVRAIVGTLYMVGIERIDKHQFKEIIESCNRSKCGTSAPACGLFLVDIQYPVSLFW
jgi:tRNA pseudouridine38-40 synthase